MLTSPSETESDAVMKDILEPKESTQTLPVIFAKNLDIWKKQPLTHTKSPERMHPIQVMGNFFQGLKQPGFEVEVLDIDSRNPHYDSDSKDDEEEPVNQDVQDEVHNANENIDLEGCQ